MSPVIKRVLLMVSLLSMIVLTWFSPSGEADDVKLSAHVQAKVPAVPEAVKQAAVASAGRNAAGATSAAIDVLSIAVRDGEMPEEDTDAKLFSTTSWKAPEVERPPPPVAQAVEKPTAPPLPFTVLGRYDDKRRSAVFLQQGEQNLAVHVGDSIGPHYKVESLNGTSMAVRYLPTNQLQTLEVGGAQ